MIFSTL